jgi:hypothetical protein
MADFSERANEHMSLITQGEYRHQLIWFVNGDFWMEFVS